MGNEVFLVIGTGLLGLIEHGLIRERKKKGGETKLILSVESIHTVFLTFRISRKCTKIEGRNVPLTVRTIVID